MKKGILLLSTMLGLATFTQAQKLALVEEFTGENCGPCAQSNPAFEALLFGGNNPSKALLIKYQSPIPSAGPIYDQNPVDVDARITYYNVPFAPYARLNGNTFGTGQNISHVALLTQAMIDAAALETSPFTLTMGTPTITGSTFTVAVTITATSAASYTNAKLRFALLEDLVFSTPPGSNGETSFEHVVRKMYPDAMGTSVQTSFTTGQTQTITVTGTIPTYVSSESPRMFVAWVQNDDNKMVLQAAKSASLPAALNAVSSEGITVANNIQCSASGNYVGVVTLKNTGTAPLTSANVYYKAGTGSYQMYSWTGNIAAGATGTATLPSVTLNGYGASAIVDSVAMPNGQMDADASNNVTSTAAYLLNATSEALPQANDFEAASPMWVGLPGNGGNPILNVDVASFASTTIAGSGYNSSQNALTFPCYLLGPGASGLYTIPKADMSASAKALDFYVAYRQYGAENDKLEVVYSTDCGSTWTSIWSKAGTALSSLAPAQPFFKPTTNADWKMNSVDVSSVPNGARLAFRATSDYGNNIWIDNVKLRAGLPTAISNIEAGIQKASIYPNPVTDKALVQLNMKDATNATFTVIDALGRTVATPISTKLNIGQNTVVIPTAQFNSGIYMVNIVTDNGNIVLKFQVVK